MGKTRANALSLCGTCLALLGTVIHVIGFSSPHWLESFEQANSRFDRIGLWEACFNHFGYDRDQLGKQYDGCHWIYSYEYKPIFDWLNPDWLLTVQIMMTLSLVINLLTSILLIVGRFGVCLPYKESMSQLIASSGMFISTFLVGISVTIFGVKSKIDRQWFPRPDQNFLTWAFGLAVLSAFFTLFAAMCLLVDGYRIKFEQRRQSRKGDPYMTYKMKPVGGDVR